jgi:hypothetical protein
VIPGGRQEGMTAGGHEGSSWGDENVLYLGCDGGYIYLYIYPNSVSCTLKWVSFIICKLHFNKLYVIQIVLSASLLLHKYLIKKTL